MSTSPDRTDKALRKALDANGQRFTEQRSAVYRYLVGTTSHPTAEDVFLQVRDELPGISLATVYKSLETLVGCGLVTKLTYGDGSARYDGRTDPHHHVRCLSCGRVSDLPSRVPDAQIARLEEAAADFRVTGVRLELTGFCAVCEGLVEAGGSGHPARA